MFFRKLTSERRPSPARSDDAVRPVTPLKSIPGGASARPTPPLGGVARIQSNSDEVGLVLDALGGVLASYARHAFDLPDRPALDAARELGRLQRHATMGAPLSNTEGEHAVGVRDREWDSVVRAFTEHRRDEGRYVASAVTELRDALWTCVETVHNAVKVDKHADDTAEEQMERARTAISRLQTGAIKQEVLGAVTAIESALRARREQHEEQYVSLATKLDRLGRQLEEAKRESTTDPLTGLGNRKLFDGMGQRAVHLHALGRAPVMLVMIDVDKLKMVNDMYGHQAGDSAITGVAKALTKVFLRQSDVVCRFGGDEFAAILHNTDSRVAQTLANRLQDMVSTMPSPHAAMEFQVGVSVGMAQLGAGEDLEDWIARADKAMYKAKQNGRGRVVIADAP